MPRRIVDISVALRTTAVNRRQLDPLIAGDVSDGIGWNRHENEKAQLTKEIIRHNVLTIKG
jgi:hypothetical protein